MRREVQPKPAASRHMPGAKIRRRGKKPEPDEFPLAHDAATWDEDNTDSSWDDEEAQLADEFKLIADD